MTLLKEIHNNVCDHLSEIDQIWTLYALTLSEKIPKSLFLFAKREKWIREESQRFALPSTVRFIVKNTLAGGFLRLQFSKDDLPELGFVSFDELETAFDELAKAWSPDFKISSDKLSSPMSFEVHIKAEGFP